MKIDRISHPVSVKYKTFSDDVNISQQIYERLSK